MILIFDLVDLIRRQKAIIQKIDRRYERFLAENRYIKSMIMEIVFSTKFRDRGGNGGTYKRGVCSSSDLSMVIKEANVTTGCV